ncbi:hypothetical protein [Streptacidiphilus carbonis]|uniref:hypothetical protein n=1 Tax=Streptacidiphilus carbonis TaxID=105422 RepID=UPI0005A88465|nr:hypothetical protein [Streptacidiphilus carbonis]
MLRLTARRSAGTAVALLLVGSLAAGCSGSGAAGAGGSATAASGAALAPPPVTATATPTSAAQVSLPLDAYQADDQQQQAISKATALLTQDCMRRLGFGNWSLAVTPAAASAQNGPGEFGFLDAARAAQWGFHTPGASSDKTSGGKGSKLDPAEFSAESGQKSLTDSSPAGGNIPAGGCDGEASRKIGQQASASKAAAQVQDDSYQRTEGDSRVVAATAAWSSCMKQQGFVYSRPDDLTTEAWAAQPTAAEIATAKADVSCTKQTNLFGTAMGVLAAIEQQEIGQHQQDLDAERAAVQRQAQTAAQVLQEHGQ